MTTTARVARALYHNRVAKVGICVWQSNIESGRMMEKSSADNNHMFIVLQMEAKKEPTEL